MAIDAKTDFLELRTNEFKQPAGRGGKSAEVAGDVSSDQRGKSCAVVNVTSDDGEAVLVIILRDRIDQIRRDISNRDCCNKAVSSPIWIEVETSFFNTPTVIASIKNPVQFLDVI